MIYFECILLLMLVVISIAAPLAKNPLNVVIIFAAFSLVMSVIWMILQSPDLAITEAAVGAGVSTVLLYITLRITNQLSDKEDNKK